LDIAARCARDRAVSAGKEREDTVTPIVSVVVPTYCRDELLGRCLSALAAQRMRLGQIEIIVADDAGSPITRRLVEDFGGKCVVKIRYVAVGPAHGPAAARNCGWRAACGEFIAFTDDDCVPQADWIEKGVAAMIGAHAEAAAGQVMVPLPPNPTDYERDCAGLAHGEFVTANCFCRRSVLEVVGGFDERFTVAWREDSDLQFTLLEHGFRIVRVGDAIVVHPVRPARWGVSLTQQRKSSFNALLYRKHPTLYRERLTKKPASYYAIGASIILGIVSLITGRLGIALACATIWAALTLRFCVVRLRGTSLAPRHIAEMFVTSALIPPLSLYWHIYGMLRHRILFR
jgi:GT2 family glycosyltransferase